LRLRVCRNISLKLKYNDLILAIDFKMRFYEIGSEEVEEVRKLKVSDSLEL